MSKIKKKKRFKLFLERIQKEKDVPKRLGKDLFLIHTHPDLCNNELDVVYRERDIIDLLKKYGFPEPDFEQLLVAEEKVAQTH